MRNIILLIVSGVVVIGLWLSAYTVTETNQALVFQFGAHKKTVIEAGLYFKNPFTQDVVYLDKRIRLLDTAEQEVITEDQKRIIVDAFVEYRIIDPLRTVQTAQTIAGVESRLDNMVISNLRDIFGKQKFSSVLSGERKELREKIRNNVEEDAAALGVEIVDFRIRRTDLPQENSEAIFRRMITERERVAKEARAKGQEEATIIKSTADKDRAVILANAQRTSEILRGEGDAKVVKIFADAYGRDQEFFAFYRSMQAYRRTLKKGNTSMVLSPDSDFFKYFGDMNGKK